jgi:hypothetical protein
MKILPSIVGAIGSVLLVGFACPSTWAQRDSGKALSVRGNVVAMSGRDVTVATTSGEVSVRVNEMTKFIAEVRIPLSEIRPGLYLGTTARKQPDGTFLASEVHVFADDERGLSEGHRPSSSVPGSTMTNANVEQVENVAVEEVTGPIMRLKYKGGEVKVFVPPNIPITRRVPGNPTMIKVGSVLSVQGDQLANGTLNATRITIRAVRN